MKEQIVILGGGVAGLVIANILPNSIVIDKNPLGQLNTPFIPGPRVFKQNETVKNFLNLFYKDYKEVVEHAIKIGYIDEGTILEEATDDFKVKYSMITRGTTKVEASFLSSGENTINILSDGTEHFYNKVFQNLTDNVKDRIVYDEVESISSKKKLITLKSGQEISYTKCYSTLNLKILLKLLALEPTDLNLSTKPKHFVQCEYSNEKDLENANKFHYMYSTNGLWTRKTYFKDYIVYELSDEAVKQYNTYKLCSNVTEEEIEKSQKDFLISVCDSNFVLNKIFNLPFQITKSMDIRNIQGIELVGRYAQWNHSIKANEVIEKFKKEIDNLLIHQSHE